jgi:hypothetical protein
MKKQEAFKRPIETYAGLLICTSDFLKNKEALSLIYASEWDDISIKVEEFQDDISAQVSGEHQKEEQEENQEENQEEQQTVELEVAYISYMEYETVETTEDTDVCLDDNLQNDLEHEAQPNIQSQEQQEYLVSETQSESKKTETSTPHFFQVLSSCYPKVQIKELGGECIRITPHDISYLPKEYWPLCNNSFLLHGFYNYRYLILCKKIIDEKKQYMLAVPGMFHQREQTMAQMFGFTEFEGNRRNAPMNFGYWCMKL